jgi:hypothetical protein
MTWPSGLRTIEVRRAAPLFAITGESPPMALAWTEPFARPAAAVLPLAAFDLAVKAALVACLGAAALAADQPHLADKGMTERGIGYPLAALAVPVAWGLAHRRATHPPPFPYLLDILVVIPFLTDIMFNLLDLYDSFEWWDDAVHFVYGVILGAATATALRNAPVGRWAVTGLVLGLGAAGAIAWEAAEYFTFMPDSWEFQHAYTDTLGDLALGTLGATIAALGYLALTTRRRRPAPRGG